MRKKIILLFSLIVLISSCAPKERLVYFQGIDSMKASDSKKGYEPILQPDDLLLIFVSAPDPEAALPYNLVAYTSADNTDRTAGGLRYQTYLIDSSGDIDFPVLGKLKLGGLTKTQAIEKLKTELKRFIIAPIVNMRITNYKISVLGEVAKPGNFNIITERITLPEALSLAGDLTIYGDRKQVLIIRDVDGVKTHTYIDITSSDFIDSPFYYLDQNDLVYINPNKTKINSSVIGPNITVGISALSLIITIIALTTK